MESRDHCLEPTWGLFTFHFSILIGIGLQENRAESFSHLLWQHFVVILLPKNENYMAFGTKILGTPTF